MNGLKINFIIWEWKVWEVWRWWDFIFCFDNCCCKLLIVFVGFEIIYWDNLLIVVRESWLFRRFWYCCFERDIVSIVFGGCDCINCFCFVIRVRVFFKENIFVRVVVIYLLMLCLIIVWGYMFYFCYKMVKV